MTDPVMQHESSSDTTVGIVRAERSLFFYLIIAFVIALVVRFFIAAPYIVSGSSMEPSFDNWNYLIVDRLSYDFGSPQRGDVVVLQLPRSTGRSLIKRIVGLPGDTVELSGKAPSVRIINTDHPDGIVLDEPYLAQANYGGRSDYSITLGPDEYFVLGDNRKVSADSRSWGVLPRSDIVGRVLVRLFPFSDISLFPAEARYTNDPATQ